MHSSPTKSAASSSVQSTLSRGASRPTQITISASTAAKPPSNTGQSTVRPGAATLNIGREHRADQALFGILGLLGRRNARDLPAGDGIRPVRQRMVLAAICGFEIGRNRARILLERACGAGAPARTARRCRRRRSEWALAIADAPDRSQCFVEVLYRGNRCHLQSPDASLRGSAMRLRIHLLAILLLSAALPAARAADDLLAFPEAQGAAARTPGGRGGKILRVTTLAPSGPGSLLAALETDGPRIVVFEVGGVIDFAQQEIKITKPLPHGRRPDSAVAGRDVDPHGHRRHDARRGAAAHSRPHGLCRCAEARRIGSRMRSRRRARTTSSSIIAR